MTDSFFPTSDAFDVVPRYGFLQPLLDGSRVLEIGAAGRTGGASALYLAELGAGAVLSVDGPEEVERASASADHPFVRFEALALDELSPGAFDLVIVTDAASLGMDPAVVSSLAAALAPGGRLVVAFRAPGTGLVALASGETGAAGEAPRWEDVIGPLAAGFASVEVVTQTPMVGWVLAAGEIDEDSDVTADGTLAGTTPPAYYLAVCGREASGLGGLALVAAPPEPLGRVVAGRRDESGARVAGLLVERAELARRSAELEAALSQAQEELARRDAEPPVVVELERAPSGGAAEIAGGDARPAARVAELERRVAELEGALSRANEELARRDPEPAGAREAPVDADGRHAALLMRLAEAEARLAELETDGGE